jgi:tripartite-type tricarboxylate transporter receptor subunit TctC
MPLLPNVPTLGESGFPDFENASWIAFFAPARTSDPVARAGSTPRSTARWGQADLRDRLNAIGLEPRTMASRNSCNT